MKRTVIKIDEEKCNGCGQCVKGCHEGALQLIDNKAVMISDMFCDGLGACIGECPVGAIELEEREAEAYDEIKVMERMVAKGENVIKAHLKHMKDHNEIKYLNQGIEYLKANNIKIDLSEFEAKPNSSCGSNSINIDTSCNCQTLNLENWPIQLHLQSPTVSYFEKANLLLASDCSGFSFPGFRDLLKDKVLSIACPKLDSNKESYVEKIRIMIDESNLDTITVLIMEVPCCGGLVQIARLARDSAKRKIPIKVIKISIKGQIIEEGWL